MKTIYLVVSETFETYTVYCACETQQVAKAMVKEAKSHDAHTNYRVDTIPVIGEAFPQEKEVMEMPGFKSVQWRWRWQ